jgi:DNA polymerase delta subunit 1
MDIFPVDWVAADVARGDDDNAQYCISVFGKTPEGRSACVHVDFFPYFYVEFPASWTPGRQKLWISEICTKHGALPGYSRTVQRVPMWGFTGNRGKAFAQLAFPTLRAFKSARYKLQQEFQTYEASVDPVVRLFHVRDIRPAQWIRVARCTPVPGESEPATTCEIEVSCMFTDLGPSALTAQPPLVLASWDIEVYSGSGKFPLADNPGDCIIQIATAFQRYGEAEPYLRTVVALDTVDDIEGIEITAVAHEHDVVNTWVDLLRREAADVMIGYNQMQ